MGQYGWPPLATAGLLVGIGDTSCLLQMGMFLGLPSIADLIEMRKNNFMNQFGNGNHAVVIQISCKNLFY